MKGGKRTISQVSGFSETILRRKKK